MKQSKFWAVINALILVVLIFWNYYSNTGIVEGETVGSISDKYPSLFTPAGYTFSIWGVIYLALLYQAVYFLYVSFKTGEDDSAVSIAAPWLILANICNGLWLWFWLHESIGTSVILIFLVFIFLMIAVLKLNMERWDAPVKYMAGVWWPIDIYVGWLAVACIANTASWLNAIGWASEDSGVQWTISVLVLAVIVNLFMIISRNMREFAVVGIWALIGIAVRHWGIIPEIQYTALGGAIVLFIAVNIHAYQNRDTLPFIKLPEKSS